MLDLLFASDARVKVLALLLLNPENSFYQRQISALTGLPIRAVQREMERLLALKAVTTRKLGNQIHYQIDKDFFLYPELRGIFLKTVGLTGVLGSALEHTEGIDLALLYGSYAANRESATSDVDILVVGDITSRKLRAAVREAEALLNREVNYVLYAPDEFRNKVREQDGFLQNVLRSPKIYLIGDDDALRAHAA
jgi:predicted nucleotidyltransferase